MTPDPDDGGDARTALARLGPFFAVETHTETHTGAPAGTWAEIRPARAPARSDSAPSGGPSDQGVAPPWRSMAELADGSDVLPDRVAAVRSVLAAGGGQRPEAVETRVAASVAHLGLAARVVSPYFALAVLRGRAPSALRLAGLRWQPALGGPFPLSLPRAADGACGPVHAGPPALADALAHALCEGPLRELADACAAFRVSPHVLWGNAASAVHGAARMIGAARPDTAGRALDLAGLLLARGPLRGTGSCTAAGGFRRRSCCLIYRAAPGGSGALCGDCVLPHLPGRSA